MNKIEKDGYVFESSYSSLNNSGLLHISRNGASVRELHFPCESTEPTKQEIEHAIHTFFENLNL
jgi:hypothetical protein